ncbi:hypothetical protein GBF38_001003, partial [Nibea albiflora]
DHCREEYGPRHESQGQSGDDDDTIKFNGLQEKLNGCFGFGYASLPPSLPSVRRLLTFRERSPNVSDNVN